MHNSPSKYHPTLIIPAPCSYCNGGGGSIPPAPPSLSLSIFRSLWCRLLPPKVKPSSDTLPASGRCSLKGERGNKAASSQRTRRCLPWGLTPSSPDAVEAEHRISARGSRPGSCAQSLIAWDLRTASELWLGLHCEAASRSSVHLMENVASGLPAGAVAAVLKPSEGLPEGSLTVRGYDFDHGLDYHTLLQSYLTTGFQATNFGQAVNEINHMIEAKLTPLGEEQGNHTDLNPYPRHLTGCTIFLGFTSNLISSGIRETIRYLVQHNMVDVLVTTAGGVEEDLIKCLAPTYIGDFSLRGKELRQNGINRIGNLLVPNDNYCKFEDWLMPILDQMVTEQDTEGVKWTPSKLIARLGKEINNPESVYYWAQKNSIPVLSPALTDGSLGDMIFFHSYKKPGLVLDIVEDLRLINTQAIFARKTGMIILGGGLVKHHIANANLMRNGADFSVYINTAQEFDGSDSGARPDEAVSWGKIRMDAKPVKVYADASLVFPLLVAETFAQKSNAFAPEKQNDI